MRRLTPTRERVSTLGRPGCTDMSDKQTHFGYQKVAEDEKAAKVAEVFHSVADRYDLMNDLMSAGMHRCGSA